MVSEEQHFLSVNLSGLSHYNTSMLCRDNSREQRWACFPLTQNLRVIGKLRFLQRPLPYPYAVATMGQATLHVTSASRGLAHCYLHLNNSC